MSEASLTLLNTTKAKLSRGEAVLGCFLTQPDADLAEFVAMMGWDFLVFDGEHGSVQATDVGNLARAAELRGVTPIARVPTNQPDVILRFLDAGAHGVHVPWVNTPRAVEAAVRSVKYGPEGQRGLAGTRASEWGLTESMGDYTQRANRETMLVVHIETADAVDAIEDYVAIDGVDVLFIGPTDLSQSLGHPGKLDHPDVLRAMETVAEVVTRSKRALGIFAGSEDMAREWIDRGARYIATGLAGFVRRGMHDYLSNLRG
jgi:4-hydroxy-2-oxoheptanedioate aldolase